jgi:hypothetical protein
VNTVADLKRKFRPAWPHLDERTRRIMAAAEAVSLGYGGVSVVSRACGLSRKAIRKGIVERNYSPGLSPASLEDGLTI